MENIETINDIKEIHDVIDKYLQLQKQIEFPTREGMIKALSDAQNVAPSEIVAVERNDGDTQPTPWSEIPDYYLYRKLSQYQKGLIKYCVDKIGESAFKQILNQYLNK